MKYFQVSFFFLLLLLISCIGNEGNSKRIASTPEFSKYSISNPKIAKGFQIKESGNIKLLEIFNTLDSTATRQKFYLTNEADKDFVFEDGKVIITPVKKLVCLSASHLSFLDALNDIDKLIGVGSVEYMVSTEFRGLVEAGKIKEIGIGEHYKLEELINLSPDLIMVSLQNSQSFKPLENAGLTIIPNGDYLESSPLGRAEWIKFIGVLTGKETTAIHIFDSIQDEYNKLKKLTENISTAPTVITGKQYGGFWNLSGGNSYEARFLNDAGANYLWADDCSTGGIMLDFETVYDRGLNADFWRFIVYTPFDFSYQMLQDEDARYADFSAFKNKRVIQCNTLKKPFFQKGLLEPQLILADYIHIFHPELLPEHENVYYELLK